MTDFDFEGELIKLLPQMRAYATVMTREREAGDDLVQDTVVRALKSRHTFAPGTNLKAWMFTILRHQFISSIRRKRPEQTSDVLEEMPSPANQFHVVALRDFSRLLQQLPPRQREALLMVGASGFTYEEAARIVGSSVGTIKSRVSRARAFLQPHFSAHAPNAGVPVSDIGAPAARKRRRRVVEPAPAERQAPGAPGPRTLAMHDVWDGSLI